MGILNCVTIVFRAKMMMGVVDRTEDLRETLAYACQRQEELRANVRRSLRLITRSAEVEMQTVAAFFHFDMNPNRLGEIDAVVIDETFAFGLAVGPRRDGLTDAAFAVGGKQFG